MIIKDIQLKTEFGFSRIECSVSFGESDNKAFIAVPEKYKEYLDPNCADPFLVAFLLLACQRDEDIIIETGYVSLDLINNIENILIPLLAEMGCGKGKSKIIYSSVPLTPNPKKFRKLNFPGTLGVVSLGGGICQRQMTGGWKTNLPKENEKRAQGERIFATGISLGVDSFYSILKNLKGESAVSATVYIYNTTYDKIKEGIPREYTDKREEVAETLDLAFIPIMTDIDQIMNKNFEFIEYHTFHNMACVLSLRNLIKGYYLSTGYSYNEMKPSRTDTACYENYIEKALNLSDFKMICSGGEVSRIEKTDYIAQSPIVQKNLNVCFFWREKHKYLNCTQCEKCIRTVLTLDVLGKLDLFSEVFDIEYYKKNKLYFWAYLFHEAYRSHSILENKIIEEVKKRGYKIPFSVWFSFVKIIFNNQIVKIKRFINGRK